MKSLKSPSRIASFRYAFQGLFYLIRSQPNAKIHAGMTILVLIAGFLLKIERTDWLWINFAISIVWISETFNTAIEETIDLVSPEYHPLAGKAKDLGAAATLLAAIFAVITGILVFLPRLHPFLSKIV